MAIVAATRQPRISSRVGVDDEGHVGKPGPGRHIGQVGDPEPVGCRRAELTLHQIRRTGCRWVGDRGAAGFAADRTGYAEFGHQPRHGAARHRDALTVEREPHFAGAIDPVVGGVNPLDVRFEVLVADLTAARFTIVMLVVGRWGDRNTQLGQLCADRLDTPPQAIGTVAAALMLSDEPGD